MPGESRGACPARVDAPECVAPGVVLGRVVALFPDTHWAAVARERLVEMGGSSRNGTAAPINGAAEEELS